MSLKKGLESKFYQIKILNCAGQAIVEYMVLLIVFALGIVVVFGGMNPDNLRPRDAARFGSGMTDVLRNNVNNAINHINGTW